MSEFQCKACGEPNTFDPPKSDASGSVLGKEKCVRCRSWNLAVLDAPSGALKSEVEMFPPDQPPDWIDGGAEACPNCKGIVPIKDVKTTAMCPKCA